MLAAVDTQNVSIMSYAFTVAYCTNWSRSQHYYMLYIYLAPFSSDSKKLPQPGINLGSRNSHKRARRINMMSTSTSAYLYQGTRKSYASHEYATNMHQLLCDQMEGCQENTSDLGGLSKSCMHKHAAARDMPP